MTCRREAGGADDGGLALAAETATARFGCQGGADKTEIVGDSLDAGLNQLPKLIQGVKFPDGIEVIGNSAMS
jgi:hypothetical protein